MNLRKAPLSEIANYQISVIKKERLNSEET